MSDTAAIDQEIDRELLGLLYRRVQEELLEAQAQVNEAQERADRLWTKLSRIEERMVIVTPAFMDPHVIKGEGGRVKKGLSDKLITDFLKRTNGAGANMDQITSATGTTTSSARRTLNKLVDMKWVEVSGRGRWKWKTDLSVAKGKEKGGAT